MSPRYSHRGVRDDTDLALMRQLLIDTYPLASPPLNCLPGELDWWRATTGDPRLMDKVRLWFEAGSGALVAFSMPRNDQVEVLIHPAHRSLEPQILQHAEAAFAESLAPPDPAVSGDGGDGDGTTAFHCWSYGQDEVRNALLPTLGYRRDDEEFLACHRLDLAQAPAPRPLPAGYAVRAFAGEQEIESRIDAHRSAFHPSKMTVEKHRLVMASPGYRPGLDIVCAAPGGGIAACTIVWFDEVNRVGIFEPVACHADHQRRGLASAVMTEGLRRLHALGARVAHVMSLGADSPGARTYRHLGFQHIGRLYQWRKDVRRPA